MRLLGGAAGTRAHLYSNRTTILPHWSLSGR